MGQDALVDVGLTWRIAPYVHEGRTSTTTIKTRESISSWETIAGMLLRETQRKLVNVILACS